MANVQITQLPAAGAITGTEIVPVVQNGVTVKTTTGAIAASPSQTQTFITVNQEPTLPNSRSLSVSTGLTVTDGGAQAALAISMNGAAASLNAAGTGFAVKTGSSTVTPRNIAVSGSGIAISNGNGQSGNPTVSLTGLPLSLANASGAGIVALTGTGVLTPRTITGTTSQIAVADGTGASADPVVSLASNPIVPGNASLTMPSGTTAERPVGVDGMVRYNTDTALFEGYLNGSWSSFASGSGVTSIATGFGLTGGPITSTGTIAIDPAFVATSGANTNITSVALTTGTVSTAPSSNTDIANKLYVDSTAQGLNFHEACQYTSTGNFVVTYNNGVSGVGATLTNAGSLSAFTIDEYTFVSPGDIGKRVLIKDQPFAYENGIYTVTTVGSGSVPWVLTRATDFDTAGTGANQIDAGDFVYVLYGTFYANTSWVQQTPLPIVVGVTPLIFIQFAAATAGVTSFDAGTTGLTPNTATAGNITLSGTLAVSNGGTGATTAPNALTNLAAAGTGITNTFTANQIVSVTDNTNAALRITQLGTGNALLVEDSTNPDSTPFVIDANGRVISGYTSAVAIASGISPRIQTHGTGTDFLGSIGMARWDISANSQFLQFTKSRSGIVGTFGGVVVSGDLVGTIQWSADDGTAPINLAQISASVDGTPGTNDMPGRLVFGTTADGASTPTERMRIDNAGRVGIGGTPSAGVTLQVNKTITGATTSFGIVNNGIVQSDVTSSAQGIRSALGTAAATFTTTDLYQVIATQGTFGLNSVVTNQYGFHASSALTGATNNYGFYGNIASGANRYNLYMNGTAANYLGGDTIINGKLGLGAAASPSYGTAGQVLTSAGSGASPTWSGISGGTF